MIIRALTFSRLLALIIEQPQIGIVLVIHAGIVNRHIHLLGKSVARKREAHVLPVANMAAENLPATQTGVEHQRSWNLADDTDLFALIVGVKEPVSHMKARLCTDLIGGLGRLRQVTCLDNGVDWN